uniref:Uncharacterized protein n=1 Tax=Ixodes ricinus TaxID=34613 RepID=A0A6B0UK57_IXORI
MTMLLVTSGRLRGFFSSSSSAIFFLATAKSCSKQMMRSFNDLFSKIWFEMSCRVSVVSVIASHAFSTLSSWSTLSMVTVERPGSTAGGPLGACLFLARWYRAIFCSRFPQTR